MILINYSLSKSSVYFVKNLYDNELAVRIGTKQKLLLCYNEL